MLPAFGPFNWLAIVVGMLFAIVWGSVLYAPPVLGNRWMKLVGLQPDAVPKGAAARAMTMAVILAFIVSFMTAVLVGWTGAVTALDGVALGLFVWIGFSLPGTLIHIAFENRPMELAAIYAGHHLVEFVALAVLLTLWV